MAIKLCIIVSLGMIIGEITQVSSVKCNHGLRKYHPGESITKDCNKCFCLQHGDWICTKRICNNTEIKGVQLVPKHDIFIAKGQKLYVVCKSAKTAPRFMWFINGIHVKSTSKVAVSKYGESILRLSPRDLARPLTYVTCFVSPSLPQRIKLRMRPAPQLPDGFPRIASKPKVAEVLEGNEIELKCKTAGTKPITVTWFKFRVPISEKDDNAVITNDGTLLIPIAKKSDSGLYECMASNSRGADISKQATEIVVNKGTKFIIQATVNFKYLKKEKLKPLRSTTQSCIIFYLPPKSSDKQGVVMKLRAFTLPIHQQRAKMTLEFNNRPTKGWYNLTVTVNLGWCSNDTIGKNEKLVEPGDLAGQRKIYISDTTEFLVANITMGKVIKPVEDFEISGKVNVHGMQKEDIPEGSCLHVGLVPKVGCKSDANCPHSSLITMKHIQLENQNYVYVKYNMTMKQAAYGKYKIAAVLQLGHCNHSMTAYQLFEINCIDQGFEEIHLHPDEIIISKDLIAGFEERISQTFSGVINFRPAITAIPSNTCLVISIWSDMRCHGPWDCKPAQRVKLDTLKMQGSEVKYNIKLPQPLDNVLYLIEAFVKFGSCEKKVEDDKKLKVGDYKSLKKEYVVMKKGQLAFYHDFTVHKIKKEEPKRDLMLFGKIKLHGFDQRKIPSSSCLIVKLEEIINCNESEGCRNKFSAEKRIQGLAFDNEGTLRYQARFRNVFGTMFGVSAILNIGWCKDFVKGSRRTRHGDFRTEVVYPASVDFDLGGFNQDLEMKAIMPHAAKDNFQISGKFELDSYATKDFPQGSCLKAIFATKECSTNEKCKMTPFKTIFFKDLKFDADKRIPFTIFGSKRKSRGQIFLSAILNIGWCANDLRNSVKSGDFVGDFEIKVSGDLGVLMLTKQKTVRSLEGPFVPSTLQQGENNFVAISGNVVLPEKPSNFGKASCLILTTRDTTQCRLGQESCDLPQLSRVVMTNFKITSANRIAYEVILKPRPKNDLYTISAVLNMGWCSDVMNGSSWLREGDFFNDAAHEFEIKDNGNVSKNINVIKFVKPNVTEIAEDPCASVKCEYYTKCRALQNDTTECVCIEACPLIYKPVCGSDGNEYPNECVMEATSCRKKVLITLAKDGPCKDPTEKPLYDPCASVKCGYYAKCRALQNGTTECFCSQVCPLIYKPVCGSDGNEYPNECVMESTSCRKKVLITLAKDGPCKDPTEKPLYDPCASVKCGYYAKCRALQNGTTECFCSQVCPLIYKPVCGSDGNEYPNECVMEATSCRKKLLITIAKDGPCKDPTEKPLYDPCAGVDCGYYAKCKALQNDTTECFCSQVCPLIYKPVCGSDGKEYPNECVMEATSCKKKVLITLAKDGPCKDPTEKPTKEPVKDSTKVNETKCESKLREIMESFPIIEGKRRPLIGAFMPQCEADGSFKEVQCHGSTGYCWCVDKEGNKREETEIRFKKPDCKQKDAITIKGKVILEEGINGTSNGSCLIISIHEAIYCDATINCPDTTIKEQVIRNISMTTETEIPYEVEMKPRPKPDRYLIGATLNRGWCFKDHKTKGWIKNGDFYNEVEHSFEVVKSGNVDTNINVKKFTKVEVELRNQTKCELKVKEITDTFPGINGKQIQLLGAYVPQCEPDGSFKEVQCHGSTGYCWCVDKEGNKREETEIRFKKPDCKQAAKDRLEIEGKVILGESIDNVSNKSCLIINVRESIYCDETENCPDYTIAEKVITNITMTSNTEISYEVEVKPRPKPNRYLISAALNIGWCFNKNKTNTWIKDGDFFNDAEHSFEVMKSGDIYEDIKVIRFTKKEDSKERNLTKCERKVKEITDTFPVINGIQMPLLGAYVPQCETDGSFKEIQCHGSTGYCWCVDKEGNKREETEIQFKKPDCKQVAKDPLRIEGKVILGESIDNVSNKSCLIINVRESIYCDETENCPDYTIAEKVIRDITMKTSTEIPYEVEVKPRPKPNRYLISAALNRGWCFNKNKTNTWIKDGDFFNDAEHSFEVMKSGDIYKDIEIRKYTKKDDNKKKKCNEACTREYEPVCGSDGKTYGNLCMMEATSCVQNLNLTMKHQGKCKKCNEACTREYEPVCGSDGKTYGNLCMMEAKSCVQNLNLTMKHQGKCKRCNEACTREYEPVCGSDGKTYGNLCMMEAKSCVQNLNLTMKHQGKCKKCNEACTREYEPVCGSDGKTYGNLCMMEAKSCVQNLNLIVKDGGECVPENATIKGKVILPPKHAAIEIQNSSCLILTINEAIYCQTEDNCPDTTITKKVLHFPTPMPPVLDFPYEVMMKPRPKPGRYLISAVLNQGWCSDGSESSQWIKEGDYFNDVESSFELGKSGDKDSQIIEVKKFVKEDDGEKKKCNEACTREYGPVCGSDGKTYGNLCVMEAKSCVKSLNLTVKQEGECVPENATIKGKVILPPKHAAIEIQNSSCLILTINEAIYCQTEDNCPDTTITKKVLRFPTPMPPVLRFPYEVVLKPRPKPGRYLISAVLNQGWCSDGSESSQWIKEGDYFNDVESSFELGKSRGIDRQIIEVKKFLKEGDGEKKKCKEACTREYEPVCGSDGKTYGNLCMMEAKSCVQNLNLTVKHPGKCKDCFLACPKYKDEVCASDGKTYDNICEMARTGCEKSVDLTMKHKGKCRQDDPCENVTCPFYGVCNVMANKAVCSCVTGCPFILSQVCGSDSVTYDNECLLKIASCKSKKHIAVKHKGACVPDKTDLCLNINCDFYGQCTVVNGKAKCVCKRACPMTFDQICGSDGTTYANECVMKTQACLMQKMITVFTKGKCIGKLAFDPCEGKKCAFNATCVLENKKAVCQCPGACTLDNRPVCGNDGKTYANECVMRSEACLSKRTIKIEHNGRCKEQSLLIKGDILSDKVIPTIPPGSCLTLTIRENIQCFDGENCLIEAKVHFVMKNFRMPRSNRIWYQRVIKPRLKPGRYIIGAVLNRGWCAQDSKNSTWIRDGDFFNDVLHEFEVKEYGDVRKDIVIRRFVLRERNSDFLVVKGNVILDKTEEKIPKKSCLSLSLREDVYCRNPLKCNIPATAQYHLRHPIPLNKNRIPYRFVIRPRLRAGRYNINAVLNRGWCAEDSNKTEWIRYGDYFNDEAHIVEVKVSGSIIVNVTAKQFVQEISKKNCTKDGKKIAHGQVLPRRGNGCTDCKCNNGKISCTPIICTPTKCFGGHLMINDGDCCPVCVRQVSCRNPLSGQSYDAGQTYFNRKQKYCEICTCNSTGGFLCARKTCPLLKCPNPIIIDSSCCPVCPSEIRCKHPKTGMLYKKGEKWSNGDLNGCSKCKCVAKSAMKGVIECTKPTCPRLNCAFKVYPRGYCCPICLKKLPDGPFKEADVKYLKALQSTEVVSSNISCTDPRTKKIYVEGESWTHNCTNFKCTKIGATVFEKPCPYLTCMRRYQMKKRGACCPVCKPQYMPKLMCESDGMTLVVPKAFIPYTTPRELMFENSKCIATGNRTHLILKTNYKECGTKRISSNDAFKYTNVAHTQADKNAIISRVRLIQIPVVCTFKAKASNRYSKRFVLHKRPASLTTPLEQVTNPMQAFDVYMKVSNTDGVKQKLDEPIKFNAGDEVIVDLGGDGLKENDVIVKADHCYATPTKEINNVINHTLIKDGCPKDPTVTFLPTTNNGQKFSFSAIVFANAKAPGFYLHCATVTCSASDPQCTKTCPPRVRRSLRNKSKLITREKLAHHKNVMMLSASVSLSG